jgi:hypothetical protein
MINAARVVGDLRVAAPEDLALLLTLSEDAAGVRQLMSDAGFDRVRFNETLASIGLRSLAE